MSRIAVAGATGQVGRPVCAELRLRAHVPIELARAHGIDVRSGRGLADALAGVSAVIDVLNADGVPDNGHYLGKAAQEPRSAPAGCRSRFPRAAHLHGFALMVVRWTLRAGIATVPLRPASDTVVAGVTICTYRCHADFPRLPAVPPMRLGSCTR